MTGFVAYYRVSTAKQGASGLGVDAQRATVLSYLKDPSWHLIAEYTEVESGRRDDRPALDEALTTARVHRAPLIVAKVDRLTRSVAFLSRLLEAGVDVRFADLPSIEGPTGRFMLQQMAAVAELEAGLISSRTRAALVAAKARGTKLGGYRGTTISAAVRAASAAERTRRSRQRALDLAPVILALQSEGITTIAQIARSFNEQHIPTVLGNGQWSAVQISRVLNKISTSVQPK